MDIISPHALRKYEEILDEINSEYETSEQLKKEIEQVENKIIFSKLSLSPLKRKISYVNVKVFSSVSEIVNLFHFDANYCDLSQLSKCQCKFLLVEVFLTQLVLEKLLDSYWKLQVCVCTEASCENRIISLSNKNSILEVIPVSVDTYECVVDTYLFYCFEEDWSIIDLCSLNIDISYHFESFKEKDSGYSLMDKFLNITKLYNTDTDLNCIKTPTTVQKQMKCNFDNKNFVAAFVQNSYHRLNLELFSEVINDSGRVVDIQFSINGKKVLVLYHKDNNVLKIKCSPCQILMMMKFFQQYSKNDYQEFRNKLQKIGRKRSSLMEMDSNEILLFYQNLRKLWL